MLPTVSVFPGVPAPINPVVPAPISIPSAPAGDKRITVWNRVTKRKIAGKAAPMEKNLADYLRRHPDCELYNGQDAHVSQEEKKAIIAAQNRIAIWNKVTRKRISGNAAPREKKLAEYLEKHPECEVYNGQDKHPMGAHPMPVQGKHGKPPSVPGGHSWAGVPGMPPPRLPTKSQPIPMPTVQTHPLPSRDSSIADIYGAEFAFHTDEVVMAGSLADMSGQSLEAMLMGMSIDEMGTFTPVSDLGSISESTLGDMASSLDYHSMFGPSTSEVPGATQIPMSPAQRIKRDRTLSTSRPSGSSFGSLAGSALAHPSQRMRQGPGPGSLGNPALMPPTSTAVAAPQAVPQPVVSNGNGAAMAQAIPQPLAGTPNSNPDLLDFWPMSPGAPSILTEDVTAEDVANVASVGFTADV